MGIRKALNRISDLKSDLESEISDLRADLRSEITDLRSDLNDHFDEIRAEIERRFGPLRGGDDEIFRPLPPPSGMDMTVLDALHARRSQRNFGNEPLPDQILSNLLYAADGINRKNGRRTTASALNWQEVDVYVLKANGIWRWVPERRGLLFCDRSDVRELTYLVQTQLTLPPVQLIYVVDYARARNFVSDAVETIAPRLKRAALDEAELLEMRVRACTLDVGIKLQSVYLAAAAMDLACVARMGFPSERVGEALRLKPDEVAVAAQSLGYPARSILDHIR